MTVTSSIQITDIAREEMQLLSDQLGELLAYQAIALSDLPGWYQQLYTIRFQLNDALNFQFGGDPTVLTTFNALIQDIDSLMDLIAADLASPTPQDLTWDSSVFKSDLNNFNQLISSLAQNLSIQEQVFYQYAHAGDAQLNNQLGQLGDALDVLSQTMSLANQVEAVLSINPIGANTTTLLNSDGSLQKNYATQGPDSLMVTNADGQKINVARYTYQSYLQLVASLNNFSQGSALYSALQQVVDDLAEAMQLNADANVLTWKNAADPSPELQVDANTNAVWFTDVAVTYQTLDNQTLSIVTGSKAVLGSFAYFWQNSNYRQNLNNLLTTLSSQNDIQKQNLREAIFIYQEFIKSAALVMDRIFDAIKSVANRIAGG